MKLKEPFMVINTFFTCVQPWLADATLLLARSTVGYSFFLAGKGKLGNLDGTGQFFESLGIPAPELHAALVGGVEMVGGLLILSGLLSRVAAIPLAATMFVAYLTAHREDAFTSLDAFVDESPYAYLIVALVVLVFGPGRASLDQLLMRYIYKRER